MERIYLDNNATTALDPRVLQAMLAEMSGGPSNPSSVHWHGQQARQFLTQARRTVASFFKARPEEIIFTSGGTEGINFLLRGLGVHGHIVTTAIEHSALYKTIEFLRTQGLSVSYVPVGLWGAPLPEDIEKAIRPDTKAVVLSLSNGETGVKIDVDAIGKICEARGIPLLLDGVSYTGKELLSLPPAVAAVAISGHKFHAPKGIGAVFLRSNFKLPPLSLGGNQESQKRAGTENLAGILGLAEALQILIESQPSITATLSGLKNHLETELFRALPDLSINGQGPRVSNTSNIAFHGVDGETLLMHLDLAGVAVSHGSACSSGSLEPSRVLTQMGIDRKIARSSLRISVGRMNTIPQIDRAVEHIVRIVTKLRNL
jgi:cysteine desulfurase